MEVADTDWIAIEGRRVEAGEDGAEGEEEQREKEQARDDREE